MRPISAVLIAVALMGGGGATFMAKKYIENRAAETAAREEELKRDVEVLVASRDLKQGHVLKATDLRWDRWPVPTAEATKVVTRETEKEILDHLPGTALRRAVVAGEPVTEGVVFKPGAPGMMPGMIAPGKRAVGIKVSPETSASGFVLPGDYVDVMAMIDLGRTAAGRSSTGRSANFATEIVLTGVRVLAVDQGIQGGEQQSKSKSSKKKKEEKKKDKEEAAPEAVAMIGRTVALEVTPEEAQRLVAAQSVGELSLLLRSLAQGTEEEPRGVPYVTDADASAAVRNASSGNGIKVIKGGRQGVR